MNIKHSIDYLKRFQEIVIFLTLLNIKKEFKSIEAYNKASNSLKARKLHISAKILLQLSRNRENNKRSFEDFLKKSTDLFIYHRHCHKTYKSGKIFKRNSWFELKDQILDCADLNNLCTKNKTLLSKFSHEWLDKHIFNYKKKEKNMTKAEKEEIKKECEEGKHAFPAEMLIKQQEKKERRETKRLMNISKKAYVELTSKITQLEAEIEQLRAENEHLKQLKDLNSDIDEESKSDLEQKTAEFEEAVKKCVCWHPENDIPEDDIPQADESQLITQEKLQEMILKQLVSKTFAQAIWKTVSGREACFNDSKNGWSVNDTQKKWKNEYNIIQIVLDNISYYQLSSDDVAHWQKRQRILKQNAVS